MRRLVLLVISILFSFVCVPFFALAQSNNEPEGIPPMVTSSASDASPDGLTSCFDYYRFGSTPVSISGQLSEVAQGATLGISGTIQNENQYPVVNASVYVKVFQKRTSGKDANGPDVVAFFKAVGPLSLKVGEKSVLSFTWSVPSDAQPGSYQIATYVAASDRFNMQGLSFTDDVIGGVYNFAVVGTETGSVLFDKSSVLVDSQPYYFAAYPPRVAARAIPIAATVQNTTSELEEVTVTWKLYQWDSLRESELIDEISQKILIHPGGKTNVSYTAKDSAHPVYYLVGTVTTKNGDQSIIGVRFVREDVQEPRINFAGVTEYPSGSGGTLFVCAHNKNDGIATPVKIEVVAKSRDVLSRLLGLTMARAVYSGTLPGSLQALAVPLPKSGVTSFDVVARLYSGDTLIDEVTVPYDCSVLGETCKPISTLETGIAIVLVGIFISLFLIYERRRKRGPRSESPISTSI